MSATRLLWDGGMRKGYSEQSLGAVSVAKAEAHRTDLELTDKTCESGAMSIFGFKLSFNGKLCRRMAKAKTESARSLQASFRLDNSSPPKRES